jgi:hypothetical protein
MRDHFRTGTPARSSSKCNLVRAAVLEMDSIARRRREPRAPKRQKILGEKSIQAPRNGVRKSGNSKTFYNPSKCSLGLHSEFLNSEARQLLDLFIVSLSRTVIFGEKIRPLEENSGCERIRHPGF